MMTNHGARHFQITRLMDPPSAEVEELLALQKLAATADLAAAVELAQSVIDRGGVDHWMERAERNQATLDQAKEALDRGQRRDELAQDCPCLGAGGSGSITYWHRGIWAPSRFCTCSAGTRAETAYHTAQAQHEADEQVRREQLEHEHRAEFLERFLNRCPAHFGEMTLDTFPVQTVAQQRVLKRYLEWAERPTPEMEKPWLLAHGPFGVGKTALSIATTRRRIGLGYARKPVFSAVPALLDRLRATFDRGGQHEREADVMDELLDSELIVLDDLGAENTTPWAIERLFVLLNHRHGTHAPTIVTTNLNPTALTARLGERIMWRIVEMAEIVDMTGCPNLRAKGHRPKLEAVNA